MIIGYQNLADDDNCVLTGSGAVSTLPVTNLKNPIVRRPFRTTAPASFTIDAQFAVSSGLQIMVLAGARLAATDLIRWQGSNVGPGLSDVFDSGFQQCNVVAGYNLTLFYLPAQLNAQYVRATIQAASKVGQGYADIGRLFIGPVIKPPYNPNYGLQDAWQDGAERSRGTRSGALFVDKAYKMRVVQLALSFLDETTARQLQQLDYTVGNAGQVIYALDPTNATRWPTEAIFGDLAQSSALQYSKFLTYEKAYQIEQAL